MGSPGMLLDHLNAQADEQDLLQLPAVTARELVKARCPKEDSLLFASEELAEDFIHDYVNKMSILEETRREMRFLPGHSYLEECDAPSGRLPMFREGGIDEATTDANAPGPHVSGSVLGGHARAQHARGQRGEQKSLRRQVQELQRQVQELQ